MYFQYLLKLYIKTIGVEELYTVGHYGVLYMFHYTDMTACIITLYFLKIQLWFQSFNLNKLGKCYFSGIIDTGTFIYTFYYPGSLLRPDMHQGP